MEIHSTSADFADEWLFCRTEPDPDLIPTRAGLNSVAVDFARSLDQSQMSSNPRLGCAGDDRFIACGDLPLQILRDTPRNTDLDNRLIVDLNRSGLIGNCNQIAALGR
jgi:hypothetical protein